MCEEALIMMDLRHHPNIISLRFAKVSGNEFLMIMDVVDGSKELSEAYQDETVWGPLCQDRTVARTTSFLSMLWYQLVQALGHLHSILIMVRFAAFLTVTTIFVDDCFLTPTTSSC